MASSGAVPATGAAQTAVERTASGPWTDLGLTLPLFLAYHLGVVYLPVRNAADWMTRELSELASHDLQQYVLLTVSIGVVYVGILLATGWGKALQWSAFAWLFAEAVIYAAAMRLVASYAVSRLTLGASGADDAFSGVILSLGAGFYEEVAFRVGMFGLGLKLLNVLFAFRTWQKPFAWLAWCVVTSSLFSLWHYVGPGGDPLELRSFVFRAVCGAVFTCIYAFRGFAPVVWTHALYDIWVLVF